MFYERHFSACTLYNMTIERSSYAFRPFYRYFELIVILPIDSLEHLSPLIRVVLFFLYVYLSISCIIIIISPSLCPKNVYQNSIEGYESVKTQDDVMHD